MADQLGSPAIARLLGVSVEKLIGGDARPAAKRGPAQKLQELERITRLATAQQCFVMQMNDTVLAQASR